MSGRSMHPAAVVGVDGVGGFAGMLPTLMRCPARSSIFDPGNALLTGKVAGSRYQRGT